MPPYPAPCQRSSPPPRWLNFRRCQTSLNFVVIKRQSRPCHSSLCWPHTAQTLASIPTGYHIVFAIAATTRIAITSPAQPMQTLSTFRSGATSSSTIPVYSPPSIMIFTYRPGNLVPMKTLFILSKNTLCLLNRSVWMVPQYWTTLQLFTRPLQLWCMLGAISIFALDVQPFNDNVSTLNVSVSNISPAFCGKKINRPRQWYSCCIYTELISSRSWP